MKSWGLIAAAVVLAALTGVLYWSDHRAAKETSTDSSITSSPKMLSFKEGDVTRIEIKKKGADGVSLVKNEAGKWQITGPKPLGADQDAISSMVSTLSSLNSDRLVEDKASDLKQFGLAEPSLELDVTTKDNKSQKVLVGDDTPTGSGAFAVIAGDPRVFTLASYTKTSVDKGLNDLRDKRLMTSDFDKVSQIELLAKKQDIQFGRNKDAWQIVKPKPLRADNFQVEELTRKLKDAKMDLGTASDDQKKTASAFAAASPIATVKVTDASGTQELQVRKNKDDYYAKSSVVAGVYKVASDVGQSLDKGVDDFRNKKLFDLGYEDPNKIEMHDGPKAYNLTKGGQDWWSDGRKMDDFSVQSFLDKVRDLSASKFVDSEFAEPALDVTVTSKDNKRVEKVLVSKNGDKYVAKRENEPALYELDSKAVTDLQKSASDLKPAPEAKPAAAEPKKK